MDHRKIFFCRKCGTLDYAEGRSLKCGSVEIDGADLEFLMFGSSVVQSPQMLILWTGIHPIEKNG